MHPLLTVVHLGGGRSVPIGSYGALLCIAIATAAAAALRAAQQLRLELGAAIAATGVTTAGAFAGATLLHGLVQWIRSGSLVDALAQPGLTVVGAILGGAIALAIAARALQLPALAWLERSLGGLLLALAVGRIGCLLGGCCFGTASDLPWSVRYVDPLVPEGALGVERHPVPVYEALCALALAAALTTLRAGNARQRVGATLLAYTVARSGLELLRADEVRGVWAAGVSTAQLACALGASAWLAFGWAQAARNRV